MVIVSVLYIIYKFCYSFNLPKCERVSFTALNYTLNNLAECLIITYFISIVYFTYRKPYRSRRSCNCMCINRNQIKKGYKKVVVRNTFPFAAEYNEAFQMRSPLSVRTSKRHQICNSAESLNRTPVFGAYRIAIQGETVKR